MLKLQFTTEISNALCGNQQADEYFNCSSKWLTRENYVSFAWQDTSVETKLGCVGFTSVLPDNRPSVMMAGV